MLNSALFVEVMKLKNYSSPIYDDPRKWISSARKHDYDWECIYYGRGKNESDLECFIRHQNDENFWDINSDDWKELVHLEKDGEEKRKNISSAERNSIIGGDDEVNDIALPYSEYSCWQKYKRYLLDKQKFLLDDVTAIENSSLRILKRMNSNTEGTPVKGLVIGNVQSGKTANMAALMAMAADYGWNMFIVLSGTIESLRLQTLNRLISDLNQDGCNITWKGISHPANNCPLEDRAQNLHFERGNTCY